MQTIENAIAIKDDSKVIQQSNQLVEQANALAVKDDASLHEAVAMEKVLKTFLEGPGTYHDEEIDMAHNLHKRLCEKRNAIIDGVKAAWKSLKDRRAQYQADQERKRMEAQRAAEAEARRIEAEKQAKIQAKIDEENRIIEAKRKEEARIQAEKDAEIARMRNKEKAEQARKDEEARRQKQAAIDRDNERRAEEKKAALEEKKEAVYVAPKIVAPVSKPQGASVSFTWEAQVINKAHIPMEYLEPNIAMMERMQKAAKGTLNIPGVTFIKKAIGATR